MTETLDPYRLGKQSRPGSKRSLDLIRKSRKRRRQLQNKEKGVIRDPNRITPRANPNSKESKKKLKRARKALLAKRDQELPTRDNGLVCPLCKEDAIRLAYKSRINSFTRQWRIISIFLDEQHEVIEGMRVLEQESCPVCMSNSAIIRDPKILATAYTLILHETSVVLLAGGMKLDLVRKFDSMPMGNQADIANGLKRFSAKLASQDKKQADDT